MLIGLKLWFQYIRCNNKHGHIWAFNKLLRQSSSTDLHLMRFGLWSWNKANFQDAYKIYAINISGISTENELQFCIFSHLYILNDKIDFDLNPILITFHWVEFLALKNSLYPPNVSSSLNLKFRSHKFGCYLKKHVGRNFCNSKYMI